MPFELLIVDYRYLIQGFKIFYLTKHPFMKSMLKQSILNMEDLRDNDDVHEEEDKK